MIYNISLYLVVCMLRVWRNASTAASQEPGYPTLSTAAVADIFMLTVWAILRGQTAL
jgi:hypothetical protein